MRNCIVVKCDGAVYDVDLLCYEEEGPVNYDGPLI